MYGTAGCCATAIGGPEDGHNRGSKTRRQLHWPRVIPHQQPKTCHRRRETSNIHIRPNHWKLALSCPAELFSDHLLTRPDHDHGLAPPRTQPGGELTEVLSRPALGFTAGGRRREADGPPAIDANPPQRSLTLVPDATRQFGAPRGIGRLKSENREDRIGIMDLVAAAIDPKGRGQ